MKVIMMAGCCLLFVLSGFSRASADNYIGIILDGYQKDCVVQSRGEDYYCSENRKLYAGDTILYKPDVNELKIKWAPYASGRQLDNTTLVVTFEPPQDKKGLVQSIKEMLGFVKTGHIISTSITRGKSDTMVAQPGDNATLITGQGTTFTWESEGGKYITFYDNKGKEIFRKDLEGKLILQLFPEEIGISPEQEYTWNIKGARTDRRFRIRVLPKDIALQVTGDLLEIEQEPISGDEKILEKAIYLQFISDAYPQDIDLYWLSYHLLEGLKEEGNLNKDDQIILEDLRRNYLRHIKERM